MELLIEILSEEIPARMQIQAEKDFLELWQKVFTGMNIDYVSIKTFVGPRRLVLLADVAEISGSKVAERRGPKVGAPEAAIQGFLKSTGFTLEQLQQENGYFIAKTNISGQPITNLLPEMLDGVLRSMPWTTSMRWPEAEHTWVRPIRNIFCVYNEKPIIFNVKAAGITTNNQTFGHRFLKSHKIQVKNFSSYCDDLENAFVIIDRNERKKNILQQLQKICTEKGLNYKQDNELLDEVTGLVEQPFVGFGKIEEKFMHLPKVVLSTSMRVHQKYFTLLNQNGTCAPYFAFVANVPINADVMIPGYEKVLRARLSDALFFYEQDMKASLDSRLDSLKNIIFHAKLGSIYDKVKRLEYCAKNEATKKAALLCKCDLTTLMVGEFPELQGIMGEIYGKITGLEEIVASALSAHYKPLGSNDDCPTGVVSWELSLLDKIDSLIGFFGIGIKPSGSKDPFGLRRAALGIVRLCLSNNQPCNLLSFLERSVTSYREQGFALQNDTISTVITFITERLSSFLKNEMPADYVYAVLDQPLQDIWLTVERAKALKSLLVMPEGLALLSVYRRVVGILKDASQGNIDISLLQHDVEKELYQTLMQTMPIIKQQIEMFEFVNAMQQLVLLKPIIDQFFDEVKVMDEDVRIQQNRLHLLQQLQITLHTFANFSKLEG